MNEIYKAIEHFERLQKRYTTQHNGKHCEFVKTALAALHEKAERSRGCVSCDGGFGDNAVEFEKLGYTMCPHCGKRLEVEHDRAIKCPIAKEVQNDKASKPLRR
jgi:DNA-directed RNA polymerase subunit RPC12/RpoP